MNKIHAQSYSLDVMWSSIKDFLPELSACLKKADFLFCNDSEFIIMQRNGLINIDSLPQNLSIFITDKTGVFYQKGNNRKYFTTIKTDDVISTVGAGDTFLGSFLSLFNGKNLNEAVYQALAIEIINEYGAEIGKNGFPKFLPGINLMHGLPGQTEKTHEINIEFLNKIYQNRLQTHRLFYRYMTPAEGIISSQIKEDFDYYNKCKNEIMQNFVIPMQKYVYPKGRQLRGFREVVFENGDSFLRTLGTCSIKVMIENKKLTPYDTYNIQILDTIDSKLLKGEIIKGN